MLRAFYLFVGIAMCTYVQAQNCDLTLKGKISDENSVDPLDGAVVSFADQQFFTDARGRFEIKNLCEGKIDLSISHIGCKSISIQLYLLQDTTIKVKLNHKEEELNEVEILAAKKESHETQNATSIVLEKLDELRGLSIGKTLEKVTGVYSLSTGATISKPVIHGLHSNRVLIMNNGVRMESQQWGSEHAPEIDPFIAKRITVIKGANSLRYGSDALGGVILVDPNPLPAIHGIVGEVNLAAFSNNGEVNLSATVEGCHHRISALSWRLQGTYRKGGNSRTPNYWLGNTGIEEGNFSVAIGYKKPTYGVEIFVSRFDTKIGIMSGSHIGSLKDLQAAIARANPLQPADFTYSIENPYQKVVHYLAKARAYYQLKRGGDLELTFAWQDNERNEFDIPHFYQNDKTQPGFYFQIQTIQLNGEWHHQTTKHVSGTVGVHGQTQTNNFKYGYFIPDFWNFSGGVFAVERWVKDKWEVEGGIRFDYKWAQYFVRTTTYKFDTTLHFYSPSGNIGFEHHPTDDFKWRMNIGSAFRSPAANELFADGVHHGAATVEVGNRSMKPEQSFNLSGSIDFNSRYFEVNTELYSNYILNFINLIPDSLPRLTIRGAFPVFRYVQQNALLSGIDMELKIKPQTGLEFFNKTSLLFARNTDKKDWLEQMPPIRFENGCRYTVKFNKPLREFYAVVSILNVLRQNFLPKDVLDYAVAPSGYWLLNFEAGIRFKWQQKNFSVGLNVDNAANYIYRDYLDRFRYYADARGINVALRFKYDFFIPQH